jgi:hypothetical protein
MDIKREIIDLETQFWQTMVDRDGGTATGLMADKSIITGAQGASSIDRNSFAKMMADGKWQLHEFAFDDVEVISPTPDVAVIGYTVKEKLSIDGKRLTLEAADASTWVKGVDGWKCILHTESVLGDPFGRDRQTRIN